METAALGLRRIKEFAREAGVTVRTLHLYDQKDLLKPAALSDAGYRLYGEAQLERLEQILALRFVGFNLEQIKELLSESNPPLVESLRAQRELIARQKRRLESALGALAQAERALGREEPADVWKTLRTVIEAFKMQNDWEWAKRYYSEDARELLEERERSTPREVIERGERDWAALIEEVERAAASGLDPSGEPARALAERWRALIAQFTQGNAAIAQGLNRMWADAAQRPNGFTRPWSDAADAFIKAALDCGS
jgi:MerR family transcriptional regulator, thiopeptide resistance regulator